MEIDAANRAAKSAGSTNPMLAPMSPTSSQQNPFITAAAPINPFLTARDANSTPTGAGAGEGGWPAGDPFAPTLPQHPNQNQHTTQEMRRSKSHGSGQPSSSSTSGSALDLFAQYTQRANSPLDAVEGVGCSSARATSLLAERARSMPSSMVGNGAAARHQQALEECGEEDDVVVDFMDSAAGAPPPASANTSTSPRRPNSAPASSAPFSFAAAIAEADDEELTDEATAALEGLWG